MTGETNPPMSLPQQTQPSPPVKQLISLIKAADLPAITTLLLSFPDPTSLVNTRDAMFKQTPIYHAVQIQDKEASSSIVKLLLEKGALIKIKDIHGQSPLFYICKNGNIGSLHLFLAQSIDINESDSFKQSPLFYASRDGQVECVKEMIKNGANPDHRDKVNETALFYAAREGHFEICKLLLDHGAEVNMVDLKRQTPISFAKIGGHQKVVDLLISRGAWNTKDGRLSKGDLSKLKRSSLNSEEQIYQREQKTVNKKFKKIHAKEKERNFRRNKTCL